MMTGRQILIRALQGKATPRPAWVPLVGVHGGHLIGVSACQYARSTDAIVAGLVRAAELYRPDGLPVPVDLQMEAEVLGCELAWADQTPPCVATHPLGTNLDPACLLAFDASLGRYPIVLEALKRGKALLGYRIALYGLVTGPFTLAANLRGNAILLDIFDDPKGVQELARFCAWVAGQAAEAYLAEGADVIAVADPITSQISPQHFQQFVTPYLNDLFASVRRQGGLSSLLVWGDATRNLTAMCQTTCDHVWVDENVCLETLRGLAPAHGKSFGGNLRLSATLRQDGTDDAKLDAIRCIDVGGHEGFVLAFGRELPYAVLPENLQAVSEMVHSPYQRQVARTMVTARSAFDCPNVALPDYGDPATVHVDVVTLDSAACGPCRGMVTAARRAAEQAAARTVVREHRIVSRRGVGMMLKLAVETIPTICIDGQIRFSSVTPDSGLLREAIDAAARNKQPPRSAIDK